MAEDKILQFLQQRLVGQLRLKRQPRGETNKAAYEKGRSKWPIVMIVKIERRWQTLWPGIPHKRVKVHGFRIHYLVPRKGGTKIATLQFDRAKWILKNFPKIPSRVSAEQLIGE